MWQAGAAVRTRKGRALRIRPIRRSDAALLEELFRRLSPKSRRLRFLAAIADLPDPILRREATRLADIDHDREAALVATVMEDKQERIVGVARLCRADDPLAGEIAFVVRDDYQGEGLGRILFERLVEVARERAFRRLDALMLAENTAMRRLIETSGLAVTSHTARGETTMSIVL
jgi:GNAT superfamily N-acetyltransferase